MSGTIRLLLADVDGTLVTGDKTLTGAAIEAARALGRAGVMLAVTSGRPPRGMKMLIGPLGLTTPIAGFNGGAMVKPDLTVIESHDLDGRTAQRAVDLIRDGGLDAWLYTAEDWQVLDADAAHVAREAWTVKFDPAVVKDFEPTTPTWPVRSGWSAAPTDLARVAACEKKVQDALGDVATAPRAVPSPTIST